MKKYFQKKFRVTDPKTRKSVNVKALHDDGARHKAAIALSKIDIHDHAEYTREYLRIRNRVKVKTQ